MLLWIFLGHSNFSEALCRLVLNVSGTGYIGHSTLTFIEDHEMDQNRTRCWCVAKPSIKQASSKGARFPVSQSVVGYLKFF